MRSCIYEGTIRHRRFFPVRNEFRYRLFLMYLDLAELDAVFALHPLWSRTRPRVAWFRREDHFGDPKVPLEQAVRGLVGEKTGRAPDGPVRVLCHLRYFGLCFNPASFYYCWDADDTRVETVVVEIHNTPWGERHCYVMGAKENEHPLPDWRRHRFAKAFHVSPFIGMDIAYDWRFREPGARLDVHMIDTRSNSRLFDASLGLKRVEISRDRLTQVLVRYPLMTVKVVAAIYWQALRLVLKGAPFHPHPKTQQPGSGSPPP
jgi:hypothetical protein